MARRAFTLIELLIIIGIMAAMVTVSIVSVRQGQSGARLRGASRDIFATIRHARSVALVSGEPSIISYSTVERNGEVCAKIEIVSSKKLRGDGVTSAETIYGEVVNLGGDNVSTNAEEGLSVSDVLFAPISEDVLQGIRIKVEMGEESEIAENISGSDGARKNTISMFSNVDYLLGQYNEAKAKSEEAKSDAESEQEDRPRDKLIDENQPPVQVVWQVNGRCDPHRVWIYLDGEPIDNALRIEVDMFGGAKIYGSGERNEE